MSSLLGGRYSRVARLLGWALLVYLGLAIAGGVFAWLLGARSQEELGVALIFAGVAVGLIGLLGMNPGARHRYTLTRDRLRYPPARKRWLTEKQRYPPYVGILFLAAVLLGASGIGLINLAACGFLLCL